MSKNTQSCNWCLTINNYTDSDIVSLKALDYKYLIYGYEKGEQEQTPHLQCYIEFNKKLRFNGVKQLFPNAHIEQRGSDTADRAANYCKKGEQSKAEWKTMHEEGPNYGKNANFVEDGNISIERMHKGTAQPNKNKDAQTILSAPNVFEAMKLVKELTPHDYLMNGDRIKHNLMNHYKVPYKHQYKSEDFDCPLIEDLTKAILLAGPSGWGKTQYALCHFERPLLVRHIDKLKELTPDNDGIVFDDMSFKHYPPEAVIHLLDMEEDTQVNVKCTIAIIPRSLPRIFTHNTTNPFFTLMTTEKEQQVAISRRFVLMELEKSLF